MRSKHRFYLLLILSISVSDNLAQDINSPLSPSITIIEAYNDNIFLQDDIGSANPESSLKTTIVPKLSWLLKKGVDKIKLNSELEIGLYHSSHNDDYINKMFDALLHKEFSHRSKLELLTSYDYIIETRGTGQSQGADLSALASPNKYVDWTLGSKYVYGSNNSIGKIEINLDYLNKEYKNHRITTQFLNYEAKTLEAIFYYRVMPKTHLLFEVSRKNIEYDKTVVNGFSLDSDETKFQVGVTWKATQKTTGRAQIGRTQKKFDAKGRGDSTLTSWEVGVRWSPLSYSTLDLTTTGSPTETNGSGDFINHRAYKIAWNHNWNQSFTTALETSFSNDSYEGSNRDEDMMSYSVGLNYKLKKWLAFSTKYKYSSRDSNIKAGDFDNNILMFSVKIGY